MGPRINPDKTTIKSFNIDLALAFEKVGVADDKILEAVFNRRRDAFDPSDLSKTLCKLGLKGSKEETKLQEGFAQAIDNLTQGEKYFISTDVNGQSVLKQRRAPGDEEGVAVLKISDRDQAIRNFNTDLGKELEALGADENFVKAVSTQRGDFFDISDVKKTLADLPSDAPLPYQVASAKLRVGQFFQALEGLIAHNDNYYLAQNSEGTRFVMTRSEKEGEKGRPLLAINAEGAIKDLSLPDSSFKTNPLTRAIDGNLDTHEWVKEEDYAPAGTALRQKSVKPEELLQQKSERMAAQINKYRHDPRLKSEWDQYEHLNRLSTLAEAELPKIEAGLKDLKPYQWLKRSVLNRKLAQAQKTVEQRKADLIAFRNQHPDFDEFRRKIKSIPPHPDYWPGVLSHQFENSMAALERYEAKQLENLKQELKGPEIDTSLDAPKPRGRRSTTIASLQHQKTKRVPS